MDRSPAPLPDEHRRFVPRKLLFGLLTLALVLVAAELGCRLLTALFWPEYTPSAIRRNMAAVAEGASDSTGDASTGLARESIHPYFGFVTTPGIGMAEKTYPVTPARLIDQVGPGANPWWYRLKANNWGFWSPHAMPYRKAPEDFVIVVLGGSVAQWIALQGEPTLSRELKQAFPALAERNVVVLNFGMSGFKQPQQSLVLTYLLGQGMLPDVVVNLDGFNEAGIGYHNALSGLSPEYPRADVWPFLLAGMGYSDRALAHLAAQFQEKQRLAYLAGGARRLSGISNLVGIVLARSARRAEAAEQIAYAEFQRAVGEDIPAFKEFAVRGPSTAIPEARRADEIVRIWLDGSLTLSAICRGRGILYLHVLQPTLHDDASKRLGPVERRIAATRSGNWGAWADGVREIYPRFRAEARALHAAGVAFEDLSFLFESTEDPIYYDICHYNQQGNELLARAIAARLAKELAR